MARMMVYNHFDPLIGESKFGDHFVNKDCSYEEAVEDTIRYMRTQYPRRAKYFDGNAVSKRVWDVTEFAKKQNKFYGASKIDDVIRKAIGHGGKQGREYHKLKFEELNIKVDLFLAKQKQPLVEAKLGTLQYEIAVEAVQQFNSGKKCLLCDLCARFGKTIWAAAVATEVERAPEIVIIASYVKTVFASFATDLVMFQQFANYEHVDANDRDYKERVTAALENNKKVFVYLSLHNGSRRQERIDFLFGIKRQKMLIVDEADYGAHKINQAMPLVDKIDDSVDTIIMTGTNSDRAVSYWPIDSVIGVTYAELLIQKEETKNAKELQD